MADPPSPSAADGPTYAPPHPPPGWIAQWDSATRKYYFVQLSTGISQWETPTEAAGTGTPAPDERQPHPYGAPPRQPELITHPDGTQTLRHPNGAMEPIMPPGVPPPDDGMRGQAGNGDRSLTSTAVNALLGGGGGGKHGAGPSPLGSLAGQFLGGHGGHSGGSGGSGGQGGKPLAGKLVSALASSLLGGGGQGSHGSQGGGGGGSHSSGPAQNYHGGQTQSHGGGGGGGGVGGLIGGILGGKLGGHHSANQQNYGYSDAGGGHNGYTGQAPPTAYQPSGSPYSPAQTAQSQHGGHMAGQQTHSPHGPHTPQQPYGRPESGPGSYQADGAAGPYGSSSHNPSQMHGYPPAQYANSFNQASPQPAYSPYSPGVGGAPPQQQQHDMQYGQQPQQQQQQQQYQQQQYQQQQQQQTGQYGLAQPYQAGTNQQVYGPSY